MFYRMMSLGHNGLNGWDGKERSPKEGLPYIPRVHWSEGSLVRSHLKWLWSEEPMVRRSFIPKFLYSESCYVPKIPHSERPSTIWILYYEGPLVRSYPSSKIAMFRTSPVVYVFCVTKVLPDDILIFRGTKYYNIGTVYLFCYNETISEVFHWYSYDLDMSCYYNVY